MKFFTLTLFVLLSLFPGIVSCSTEEPELPLKTEQPTGPDIPLTPDQPGYNENDNAMSNKLNVRIGNASFRLTLEKNATAAAFRKLLPLTLNMSELNGNEKFFNLSIGLPTAASRPGTLRAGDLMLFGSDCVVLFYETFSSSYSYTPIGSMDDTSGFATMLGKGNVTVSFETIDD